MTPDRFLIETGRYSPRLRTKWRKKSSKIKYPNSNILVSQMILRKAFSEVSYLRGPTMTKKSTAISWWNKSIKLISRKALKKSKTSKKSKWAPYLEVRGDLKDWKWSSTLTKTSEFKVNTWKILTQAKLVQVPIELRTSTQGNKSIITRLGLSTNPEYRPTRHRHTWTKPKTHKNCTLRFPKSTNRTNKNPKAQTSTQ